MKAAYGRARLGTIAILGVAAFAIMAAAAAAPRASTAAKHPATIAAPKANAPSAAAKLAHRRSLRQTAADASSATTARPTRARSFSRAAMATRCSSRRPRRSSLCANPSRTPARLSKPPPCGARLPAAMARNRQAPSLGKLSPKSCASRLLAAIHTRRFRVSINFQASPITSSATTPGSGIPMCPTTRKLNSRMFIRESTSSTTAANRVNSNTTSGLRRAPIPKAIRLSFRGAERLALDRRGDLIVSAGKSRLVEHAPQIYQEIGGTRAVKGGWVLRGAHEAGFRVARYDRTKPIVIDPVLVYSTYLGGSNSGSKARASRSIPPATPTSRERRSRPTSRP